MLRTRSDRCPLCAQPGVALEVRCPRCGEKLPWATPDGPSGPEVRGVGRALGEIVGGAALGGSAVAVGVVLGVAAAVQPLVALGIASVSSMAILLRRSTKDRVARRRPRPARRGPLPRGDTFEAARHALAKAPDEPVTIRGRVRLEVPVVEGTDDAVRNRRVGRFVIETDAGEALVDDDGLVADASLVVRDGEEVEVTGPARLVHDHGVAREGYRGPAATRIVFDGTLARPLIVRAATAQDRAARSSEPGPRDPV